MTKRAIRRSICVALILLIPVAFYVWYCYQTTTVPEVEKRLSQEVPIGTPRAKVESWLDSQNFKHHYSEDFRYNTVLEQNGVDPKDYVGFITAIIRDTDRDLFVTGSIQIYILFDRNDCVAKHIVRWVGTGP